MVVRSASFVPPIMFSMCAIYMMWRKEVIFLPVMIKNTSLPFTPGDSSTSCHGREQHEMGDEHSGLYTTTAGTSFLHDNGEIPLLPNVDVHEPGNGLGQRSDALLGMLRLPKPFTKNTC